MNKPGYNAAWTWPECRNLFLMTLLLLAMLVGSSAPASTLRISAGSSTRTTPDVEADYTTTHLFINEVAGARVPITLFFDPQTLGVQTAEIFSNLNRRERATKDADGDGIEDGIKPPSGNSIGPDDDHNYYKAYPMQLVSGGYQLTLFASKCGAYRLTARFRLNSDPPGTYHWYGDELNAQGVLKRDHAIVVSPAKAQNIQLYEADPLIVIATGSAPNQRGTFADLASGRGPRFSLSYLKNLGVNTLWLLPIHANAIDGRQADPITHQPFDVGSPYAVKNFFTVMPLLAKSFKPGATPAANDTPAGRASALREFQQFVQAADTNGIDIMLDAPFNHAAHDVELAQAGQNYWGNANSSGTTEIRSVEARVFSRVNAYDMRAVDANSIAPAPDRYDFGKWNDTFDLFFGRYAALVPNASQSANYVNEGDWFDFSQGSENASGAGNGHFDSITQKVWRYFGDYLQFWLDQTGYPANTAAASLDSNAGVDGLRGDFGQGLPPQCWEYLINRTRSRKWNFVFMAESLDGGPVTYRSGRHFDVLNENLFRDLRSAQTAEQFRALYDGRFNSYGHALVLLNTSSHDEDNFSDPFEGLLRFAINSAMFGVPLISSGQELGLRGTIRPPNNDSDPSAGPPFGYERYFSPFDPKKRIPQFMTFNSMMPLWQALAKKKAPSPQLLDLYSAIGQARRSSPALRSSEHFYLNLLNGTPFGQIFSVAKVQRRNGDPGSNDVVFAFINLSVSSDAETAAGNWFNVDLDTDRDGTNDFGIKPDHLYNVKNIAAYTGIDAHRRDSWLWGAGRKGSDLLQNGVFVRLNHVPANQSEWASAPYEAQFLKLFDVTPPVPNH